MKERGEVGFLAVFGEVFGELREVGFERGLEDGMVGLIGLDDNRGGIEVTAADTTDDLSEELESALLGGKIWEGESGVGLDDADGGEARKIEATSEGLGTDEDVDGTGFHVVVEGGEVFGFFVIAVEAGDFGFREEFEKFGFEELGAKTFMDDARMVTFGAVHGDFFGVTAEVTAQSVIVGVKSEGKITIRAEGLPAAILTNGHRGGTASIMKN